jgi:hypothetical protein
MWFRRQCYKTLKRNLQAEHTRVEKHRILWKIDMWKIGMEMGE